MFSNMTFGPPAKFVRRYGDAAELITNAVRAFGADVRSGQYPADGESYHSAGKETKAASGYGIGAASGRWGG